jgi:hypothetical protein
MFQLWFVRGTRSECHEKHSLRVADREPISTNIEMARPAAIVNIRGTSPGLRDERWLGTTPLGGATSSMGAMSHAVSKFGARLERKVGSRKP